MTLTAPPPRFHPTRHFDNAAEWLHALGDVPLERIVFDPLPGTATEADLLVLAERDKRLCELIDGTLVEKPVGCFESLVAMNLAVELGSYVKRLRLGAVFGADATFRMISGRVRMPDASFIATRRLPAGPGPVPQVSPDLAVDVLSESNTPSEIDLKLIEYFQSGTRLAWIIDRITRTVAVYYASGEPARELSDSDMLDGEDVMPGFSMPVSELFIGVPGGPVR